MTGSNHVVTGALIATAIPQPAVAIPVALASHFVLDMLPHYGENGSRSWLSRHFKYILSADIIIGIVVLGSILILQPANWILVFLCGLVAALPDAVWIQYYLADLRRQPIEHGPFARFSKWIQWGERPWGIYIELVWLLVIGGFLFAAMW